MKKHNDRMILRLVKEARPIWPWLWVACILSIAMILCGIFAPQLLGDAIDLLYARWEGTFQGDLLSALVKPLRLVFGLYLGYNLFSYLKTLLLNKVVSRHFTCTLRIRISDKLRKLPVGYVDQTSVGDVLSRMTEDVSTLGGYIHDIVNTLMSGFLMIIAIAVMMFLEDWRLALVVVAMTPLSIFLSSKVSARSEAYYDEMFEEGGKLNDLTEECFTNFATGKAYNLEEYAQKRHTAISARQRDTQIKAQFTSYSVQPLIACSNALAYAAICLLGGWLVVKGSNTSVGIIVTILLYAKLIAAPLEQIAGGLSNLQRAKAAARRVFALMDLEEEPVATGTLDRPAEGNIRFEHVDFSYSKDTPLIEDLNIDVKKGQNVAIVGPTGAGKTTIVNLLMRFYDVDKGRILIDGVDCATLSRDCLRDQFAMVLQDTWLFRGTIAENVAYGKPDATREEIIEACDRAYCDHFIRTLPEGYDTIIGDDMTNLSGGQKQLLTIARAMLADRRLLILDEATSNVDTRTEILLQKAMKRLMRDRTCFIIAHRLSTIVDSNLILVLNDGKIVEQGTHKELLEKEGFYHRIYTSQYAI